jgi:hypothetical protein
MSAYSLLAYVLFEEHERAHRHIVGQIVREVLAASGVTPERVWGMRTRDSGIADRPFTAAKLDEFIADEERSQVMLWSEAAFDLSGQLLRRPSPSSPGLQPQKISLIARVGDGGASEDALTAAAETLLRRAAERLPVFIGGAQPFATDSEALTELQPSLVQSRVPQTAEQLAKREGDHKRERHLRHQPRRLYWRTLLGPRMAAAMGGLAAARAAGDGDAEELAGCVLVHAGARPSEALSPEWKTRWRSLRQWMWTHSSQNPVDAVE